MIDASGRWPGLVATLAAATSLFGSTPSLGDASPPTVKLVAFAAANTTDPFNDVIGAFERDHAGVLVLPEYAGTQILETQAEQGAPFDVFISADRQHIDALQHERLVQDVRLLSLGHEVIIVPKDDPAGIESLADLASKDAKIVIGTPQVPIGAYTRQVLQNASRAYGADFSARVMAHVVSLETNVKQVLEKVALGDADAGVVYYTDVSPQYRDKVRIVPIPSAFEVEAANYVAVGTHTAQPALAHALEDAAAGPSGRAIFRRHGYDPIP